MTHVHAWTPERIETLCKMWGEGKSSGHIAACLGVTRNAVMGQVHKHSLIGKGGSRMPRPQLDTADEHERDNRDLDILAHIDAGYGLRETARILGIDQGCVSRIAGEAKTREARHAV